MLLGLKEIVGLPLSPSNSKISGGVSVKGLKESWMFGRCLFRERKFLISLSTCRGRISQSRAGAGTGE